MASEIKSFPFLVIITITLCSSVDGSFNVTDFSLDDYFYKNALDGIPKPDTGKLYNVTLPANLSGAEMSFSRIKSHALWKNGSNHTYFTVPHWTMAWPITTNVDMVYYNLGNLSKSFFDIENHTFVAPVLGLLAYLPRNFTQIGLKVIGDDDSIVVRFRNVSLGGNNGTRCVRFDSNGTLEFRDVVEMERMWLCGFQKIGHFSIVVPKVRNDDNREIRPGGGLTRLAKIVIGFACGVFVLVLIVAFGVWWWCCWNGGRSENGRPENMSELEMALGTLWVGRNNILRT